MAYTTIDDPSAHFQTTIYTGNGSDDLSITNGGNSDLQPDFVWLKNRAKGDKDHILYDSSRGATKQLHSNNTNAESTVSGLTDFNSDGFTIDDDGGANTSGDSHVAWQWKANGGSLTSVSASGSGATNILAGNYQANTTAGFSIMTFTGDETQSTVTHGLGAAPDFIIVRARTRDDNNWITWHSSASTGTQYLNGNNANDTSNGPYFMGDDSNITQPTSTVFTVGANIQVNHDGASNVAWAWRSIQGYSKFGSYTGNGNADGTFIYLGFKPAWLLVKQTDGSDQWQLVDHKRDTDNIVENYLIPDSSQAETSHANNIKVDFLSNGFKCRATNSIFNGNDNKYIYMAFAENPFVTSGGVPCTAR